ncbi:TetR family transcriptional regulator C-terminal domain-containing protein [Curtobacterium sp. MCPF17_002]|uniref:TetR family transcriptional regulator C-terminal domain-containing protein n=1 Tax=Curtobacterium sp. MCPF17_002 TaxID=2175645 RepID=UPI000DA952AB|nr:TetR family transcriptional regulator C-terminal domain-containing protein [Curtobacterium sp. MCPF17_002]WIB77537.1 TetR family transcriptional regulator C-terminal domain-containing protein [Curtobacterium sp. MCPF17_002]
MPTTPARRRLSPAEREAQITAAAIAVARADGLAGVTLRGVAAAIGVAPSLVAHYRPAMEDLVGETFRTVASAEVAEVRSLVTAADGPVAQLRTLLACIADPDRDDVATLWADAWSTGRTNPVLAAAAREVMDDWQLLATTVVADGVRDGVMRTDDPDGVGRLLFALVDATNGYALVDYLDRQTREGLVRTTIAHTVGLDVDALS